MWCKLGFFHSFCFFFSNVIIIAPALEAVEYVDQDFADSFNSTSIYRGPPNPEREAAWDKLTYSKSFRPSPIHYKELSIALTTMNYVEHGIEVPESELAGLNRSPADNLKKVPKEVGNGYVGILEVFHQLHCLVSPRLTFLTVLPPTPSSTVTDTPF